MKSRYVAPLGSGGYGTGRARDYANPDLIWIITELKLQNVWVLGGAGCEYYFSPEEEEEDEEEGKQVVESWSWVPASM
jgi:hypothetical protein